MPNKILITNKQLKTIKENLAYESIVAKIVDFLNKNYEPTIGSEKTTIDYIDKQYFKVKIDDRMIKADELLNYLKYKFNNLSDEFLKQLISDWSFGKIKNNRLSKNVSLDQ